MCGKIWKKKQSDILKIESHKVRVCRSKVLQKTDFCSRTKPKWSKPHCFSHASEPVNKHSVNEHSLCFSMFRKRFISLCDAIYEKSVNSKWKASMQRVCGSLYLCSLIVHEIDSRQENSAKISQWNIKLLLISVGNGLWHPAVELL